ncbi:MAG: dienelactone hydrolase family protein [Rhodospirillaceae bacterium]|jgi:carboxymethylenebutenolidase|nr:dienelactone hydrolase family protein [Rhodospirillaceae bacterium]
MTKPQLTTITTRAGRESTAMVALPDKTPAPGMALFHAFLGLTQEFIDFAECYASKGYIAVAPDFYNGETTRDFDAAYELMGAMDEEVCTDMAVSWVDWMHAHDGCSGRVGTVGWCLGGTWSLNTSLATPIDASVVYYGSVAKTKDALSALRGPVLGHFGTQDEYFGKDMVDAFEVEMDKAGKPYVDHWYEADHAFANTGGAHYHEESAELADTRTFRFFEEHLT